MNSMLTFTMQMLIKVLTPSSPAFNNNPAFFKDQQSLDQVISKLAPGDIILSKTGSTIYEIARGFVHMDYDHVAVVINKKQVIHVSPPIISKLNIEHIVRENRYPVIFRPSLSQQQLYTFLSILQGFLGEKYNVKAIPKIALAQIKRRVKHFSHYHQNPTFQIQNNSIDQGQNSKQSLVVQKNGDGQFHQTSLKYSRICSDAILYALCRSSKYVEQAAKNYMNSESNYKIYGFSLPDDLLQIMNKCRYPIVYKSNKNPKPNPFYSAAKDIYNYPYSVKCSEFAQFISSITHDISDSVKSVPQKMTSLVALENLSVKKLVGLLNKGIVLQGHYLQVTLVISLVLKICQLLGFRITTKSTSLAFDLLGIVLMALLFSLFPNGLEQLFRKIQPKL